MDRCEGSGKREVSRLGAQQVELPKPPVLVNPGPSPSLAISRVARDVRRSTLGGKFFGKSFGTCSICGAPVGIRKGTKIANPHNPKEN